MYFYFPSVRAATVNSILILTTSIKLQRGVEQRRFGKGVSQVLSDCLGSHGKRKRVLSRWAELEWGDSKPGWTEVGGFSDSSCKAESLFRAEGIGWNRVPHPTPHPCFPPCKDLDITPYKSRHLSCGDTQLSSGNTSIQCMPYFQGTPDFSWKGPE